MDATRISDGRPVMLKQLPSEEGPYELEISRLFSTEPLFTNPRNHCVQLLDVIELPDDPPIMVHPLLRPFYDPPFQTYGEFVTFFAQLCEVSSVCFDYTTQFGQLYQGVQFMHENHVAHRYVAIFLVYIRPPDTIPSVTARLRTSCLTRQICIPNLSTLSRLIEVRTFAERPSGTREPGVRRGTSSSTLACPVDTILPMGHRWRSHCAVVTSPPQSTGT